jgi:hypothetical protein
MNKFVSLVETKQDMVMSEYEKKILNHDLEFLTVHFQDFKRFN